MATTEEEPVLRKKRKGYEKKQEEKEGVSFEPGVFSTRFVFFFLQFVAHLSSLKLCFFALSATPTTPAHTDQLGRCK